MVAQPNGKYQKIELGQIEYDPSLPDNTTDSDVLVYQKTIELLDSGVRPDDVNNPQLKHRACI